MLAYFLIFCFGFLSGVFCIVMLLRYGWRHKEVLIQLLHELYHVDLLNHLRTLRGLLKTALAETHLSMPLAQMYIEMALKKADELDESIAKTIKKYEPFSE